MPRFQTSLKLPFLMLIIGAVLVAGVFLVLDQRQRLSVNSFEECAEAGNPIMESFPERCAANGKVFVNPSQSLPAN